jgi:hypothetical protein
MKAKILGLLIFLFCISESHAGMRPSFSLEYSAWNATHIVIAAEGEEIDGKLEILEPLKGDLGAGEMIFLNQLAGLKTENSRQICEDWNLKSSGKFVSGSRMILFLRKDNDSKEIWKPTDLFDELKTSVMWIENDKAYAFEQIANPGPSLLIDLGQTESEVKTRILEIIQKRNSFDRAFEIKGTKSMFENLRQFFTAEDAFIRLATFKKLKEKGKSALPVLRRVLDDESALIAHDTAVQTFGEVGGESVGKELTALLKKETNFWKELSDPQIKNWKNRIDNNETEIFGRHYSKILQIVYQLRLMKLKEAQNAVSELCRFWHSSPLEDKDGLSQMTEDCDAYLTAVSTSR